MNDLFTIPETLSPRLRWMQEHDINVIDNGRDYSDDDESPETGERLYRFCAHQGKWHPARLMGFGDTEDDALVDLAKKLGIKLWMEV